MNCDFVKSLTAEQKASLKKALEEEDKPTLPKYEVYVEYWENGNIFSLIEYLDDKNHGKCMGWHENGQKKWEYDYEHDKLIKEHQL